MYDRWEYTVPANTAEASSIKVECKVSLGTLTDLRVYAPLGCAGLLRCRVFIGEKSVAPRSAKSYLAGEGFIADLRGVNEPISGNLPVLRWELWNLDDTNDHTPWMDAAWVETEESYDKLGYVQLRELATALKRALRI